MRNLNLVDILLLIACYENIAKCFNPEHISTNGPEISTNNYRLPDYFLPISQHISLQYNPIGKKFLGYTKIHIEKTAQSNNESITINSHNLTFSGVSVTYNNKSKSADYELKPENEQLYVKFPFDFMQNSNSFTLELYFESEINGPGSANSEDLKSAYWLEDESNETNGIATQFEASFARTLFPCFDEPKFRTKFSLDLNISDLGSNYKAFSNERQISTSDEASTGLFRFDKTKPIPSYLVAFAVLKKSDFNEVLNFKYGELPIRVIIPRIYLATWDDFDYESKFQDVIIYILTRLERDFETPWQMSSKLDIILVEHENQGMENTGLITLRSDLLTEDASDIIDTLVHELVHQWTGGIMTCEWWSHLWLNEGMTTYFSNQIFSDLFPENETKADMDWRCRYAKYKKFKLVSNVGSKLAANSSIASYNIYSVGSVATSMLNMAMNDTLMRCLGVLFKTHPYQSMKSKFVMDELTKCPYSDLNATQFMRFWLLSDRIPILKMSKTANNSMQFSSLNYLYDEKRPDPLSNMELEPEFVTILRDPEGKILQKFPIITGNNSQFDLEFDSDENELYFANVHDPVGYVVQYDDSVYEQFFNWLEENFIKKPENLLSKYYITFILDMGVLSGEEFIDMRWLFRTLQDQFKIMEILDHEYNKIAFELLLGFFTSCLDAKVFSNLPQNETALLEYSCTWSNMSTVLCGGKEEISDPHEDCESWYPLHGEHFKQILIENLDKTNVYENDSMS